jgi:hypothetical protein
MDYHVTRDGRRFIHLVPPNQAAGAPAAPRAPEIHVVMNWVEELKAKVPVKR